MATQALTKTTFDPTVEGDGIVLVDFWAASIIVGSGGDLVEFCGL